MSSPKLLRGRISTIGACYVVTAVTQRRQPLLTDPALAALVVSDLNRGTEEGDVEPLAWVVMPDHVHWLFRLAAGTVSQTVQKMKSRSARSINAAMRANGPLWQAGFHDQQIRDERKLRATAHYVVCNPIRRGLVGRIEDYPFWWCRWIERSGDL